MNWFIDFIVVNVLKTSGENMTIIVSIKDHKCKLNQRRVTSKMKKTILICC